MPPHTQADERWKDLVFAGKENMGKAAATGTRVFFLSSAQGDHVSFTFYIRTAQKERGAPLEMTVLARANQALHVPEQIVRGKD